MHLRLILVLKEFNPLHKPNQYHNPQYAMPRITHGTNYALVRLCLCLVVYDAVQSG